MPKKGLDPSRFGSFGACQVLEKNTHNEDLHILLYK